MLGLLVYGPFGLMCMLALGPFLQRALALGPVPCVAICASSEVGPLIDYVTHTVQIHANVRVRGISCQYCIRKWNEVQFGGRMFLKAFHVPSRLFACANYPRRQQQNAATGVGLLRNRVWGHVHVVRKAMSRCRSGPLPEQQVSHFQRQKKRS